MITKAKTYEKIETALMGGFCVSRVLDMFSPKKKLRSSRNEVFSLT